MKLNIERHDGTRSTGVETYDVPDSPGLTVLDAVLWIREHHDPSIAVRFSCRSANACKECLAMIDGERTYMCTYRAVDEVTVKALPKNIVRDLVTGS